MRVVTATESYMGEVNDVKCFLAGGITNCPDWQKDVIKKLSEIPDLDDLVLFNPRRDNFPIHDPNASNEQIKWEFDRLQVMDIFSMFFCGGGSDQPICMYELGRNLMTMQIRFLDDWKNRLVITCDMNYKRYKDVLIQTGLAVNEEKPLQVYCEKNYEWLIDHHVSEIVRIYKQIKNR